MASDMASYIESLALEVKEMDDRIEYLASKRLWAENKLQTEKLKIGKELSLKMLLVETKRAQKKYHREGEAKLVSYLETLFKTVTRRRPPLHPRRQLPYILDWKELEARPDTAHLAVTVGGNWVGPCGTRSSMPEADSLFPVATPSVLASDIFVAGARTSDIYPTGDEAIAHWDRQFQSHRFNWPNPFWWY